MSRLDPPEEPTGQLEFCFDPLEATGNQTELITGHIGPSPIPPGISGPASNIAQSEKVERATRDLLDDLERRGSLDRHLVDRLLVKRGLDPHECAEVEWNLRVAGAMVGEPVTGNPTEQPKTHQSPDGTGNVSIFRRDLSRCGW